MNGARGTDWNALIFSAGSLGGESQRPSLRLYVRLLSDVRSANVAEAVDEFERRFAPLLDQQALQAWKTITAPFKRI
jgi:hypothetical protein